MGSCAAIFRGAWGVAGLNLTGCRGTLRLFLAVPAPPPRRRPARSFVTGQVLGVDGGLGSLKAQ
jgi:hypothetical protein